VLLEYILILSEKETFFKLEMSIDRS